MPGISTPESLALVNFIEKTGIRNVRLSLSNSTSTEDPVMEELIQLFKNILNLDLPQRNQGLAHLLYELEYLSLKSSEDELRRLRTLYDEIAHLKEGHDYRDLENEAKLAVASLDGARLYIHHFFHKLNDKTEGFFQTYAQYLECGHPVELFNDNFTEGNIMWGPAIKFCFEKLSNQRVFVLSILGLRSTFKSTLLNELFGKSFEVGDGGCTQGLFMRLINLEPEMQTKVQADVLILLDSEGLRAPHNWSTLNQKEKLLMTFILGISHLTLIKTKEGHLVELKDLLEISLFSMYTVPNLKILPDVLIVEPAVPHVACKELEEILNAVVELQHKFEFGATNSKCFRFDKLFQSLASL
jgi:hypothetical protein